MGQLEEELKLRQWKGWGLRERGPKRRWRGQRKRWLKETQISHVLHLGPSLGAFVVRRDKRSPHTAPMGDIAFTST